MNSTEFTQLIPDDSASRLDLDTFKQQMRQAADSWAELEQRTRLYETELQRELRAKVDLTGSVPGCLTPETAFGLTGFALLSARREATHKFNQIFHLAPLCQRAQTPVNHHPRSEAYRNQAMPNIGHRVD